VLLRRTAWSKGRQPLAGFSRVAAIAALWLLAFAGWAPLFAQGFFDSAPPPPPRTGGSPICQRLEDQLGRITQGDGGQAAQAQRYEQAIERQQAELERAVLRARQRGCESSGLFSLFNGQAAQCGPINDRISQMRANLDRMIGDLQRLQPGNAAANRETQRRSVITALAQNNCGPQYAAAARQFQQGGLFDSLFGNNWGPAGPQGNTFRTVCVRTCDGYFFPISFATVLDRLGQDQAACQQQCPAAEVQLYYYRNPGEDMSQAVSIAGQPYSSLPTAFQYRKAFNPSCTCKQAGQSWADAMKHLNESDTLNDGDIIVTDERAKKMAQPPAAQGQDAPPASKPKTIAGPTVPQGKIRSVGPIFVAPKDE